MDFLALPPEVTSARMYSGPGAGSLYTAAAAWDALAAELHTAAAGYREVISGLTDGSWSGPSSESMASAAAPYAAWLSSAAAHAKQAAAQSRDAATGYETAVAATVPPPVIAANRSQLASLVASNIFGQNIAAIAATEAQYGEMWAQDAAAMYGYAASSAAATKLTRLSPAPQTTSGSGPATRAAAAAQPTGTSGGTQSVLSGIPNLLQQLATGTTNYNTEMGNLLNGLTGNPSAGSMYSSGFSSVASVTKFSTLANDWMSGPNLGMVQFKTFFQPPGAPDVPISSLGAGLGLQPAVSVNTTTGVSAGVAEAATVGRLSVPPSWAAATPAIRLAATALPSTGAAAVPAFDLPGGLLPPAAIGSMAGGAVGGGAPRVISGTRGVGRATGGNRAPVQLDRVIAQLQRRPETVQHWQVDEAGLDDLLADLAKKPGNHAVHLSRRAQPTAHTHHPTK